MKTEYTFSKEELELHDKRIAERAYRTAAAATMRKMSVLLDKPILDAIHDIHRYVKYLAKEYKLENLE